MSRQTISDEPAKGFVAQKVINTPIWVNTGRLTNVRQSIYMSRVSLDMAGSYNSWDRLMLA